MGMKSAAARKKTPSGTLSEHLDSVHGEDGVTFMAGILRRAGITAKQFQYAMRISKTYQQKLYRGEVPDWFDRAKEVCAMISKREPALLSAIVLYILGDAFNECVIDHVKKSVRAADIAAAKESDSGKV